MFLTKKQNIVIAVIVAVFAVGLGLYTFNLLDPVSDVVDPLAGLFIPAVKINDSPKLDNKIVNIEYTDDNSGETLIIKSDKSVYNSFSTADVYFSITNDRIIGENVEIRFLFPREDQGLTEININTEEGWEKIALFEKPVFHSLKSKVKGEPTFSKAGTVYIDARDTIYLKAKITFKPQTQGEFFIEAIGDRGGYGYLE